MNEQEAWNAGVPGPIPAWSRPRILNDRNEWVEDPEPRSLIERCLHEALANQAELSALRAENAQLRSQVSALEIANLTMTKILAPPPIIVSSWTTDKAHVATQLCPEHRQMDQGVPTQLHMIPGPALEGVPTEIVPVPTELGDGISDAGDLAMTEHHIRDRMRRQATIDLMQAQADAGICSESNGTI